MTGEESEGMVVVEVDRDWQFEGTLVLKLDGRPRRGLATYRPIRRGPTRDFDHLRAVDDTMRLRAPTRPRSV